MYLRYYFASKLSGRIEDIDLNFEDFRLKVNADLVGKVVNIASRAASFIHKYFAGQLSETFDALPLIDELMKAGETIKALYENREYSQAIREIMGLADKTNQYIDTHKPWQLVKTEDRLREVQTICTVGINCFRLLMIYLKPILPSIAEEVEAFLNVSPFVWADHQTILVNHAINEFSPLIQRVTEADIATLKEAAKR